MAFLLEDIGIFAALSGDARAALGGSSGPPTALREAIGAPRAPALEEEIATALADARAALGEEAAEAAVERGRAMEPDQVEELGRRICEGA